MRKLAALLALTVATSAFGAQEYPDNDTPGQSIGTIVVDCINSAGKAQPESSGACAPRVAGGANNFATSQATAATTASTPLAAARAGRVAVTITNLGTVDIWLGATTGVTTTTGTLLPGTKGASVTIPTNAAVYGVVATGTQAVSVMETY